MTRIICLFILATFISTAGISQKYTTALEFNNYIVTINDSLYKYGSAWGTKFVESRTSHKWEELTPHRLKLENFIQKKREELKKLAPFKGSEDLVASMLDFLKMESQMAWKAFAPFEAFDENTSSDEMKDATDNLMRQTKVENEKLEQLRAAQDRYATKNGFSIEKAGW
jgi:hypothetical protein